MLFTSPDTLYTALLNRDASYDGHVFVCVTTTSIFCRLTCPARKPKREHVVFHDTIQACLTAGFRPCLRCRPLATARTREPLVAQLLDALDAEPERLWSEDDLIARGHDPSTVRRAFKRHLGLTFLDLARLRQAGRGLDHIAAGGRVIEAQLEAGYESSAGFRNAIQTLLGDTPARLQGRNLLKADWLETPIGAMLAVADAQRLHLLEFFDRKALPGELTRLREATRSSISFGRLPPIDAIEAELAAYFAGSRTNFTTQLALHGTPFTKLVWEALVTIPLGETRSYSGLAATINQPAATRAVARANGANQLAILIPCHRVIGTDGSLTGYGGGLWRKDWLIRHEAKMAAVKESTAFL
jgi:AraC family transcriptional regulator of adaptative response/methylated-DNA-[protein]-cysteine methyltransferase